MEAGAPCSHLEQHLLVSTCSLSSLPLGCFSLLLPPALHISHPFPCSPVFPQELLRYSARAIAVRHKLDQALGSTRLTVPGYLQWGCHSKVTSEAKWIPQNLCPSALSTPPLPRKGSRKVDLWGLIFSYWMAVSLILGQGLWLTLTGWCAVLPWLCLSFVSWDTLATHTFWERWL